MTRENIIELIKAMIDELSPFEDASLNPSIPLIDRLLNGSIKTILLIAPLHLLKPTSIDISASDVVNGIGEITLPDDFIRLHSVKFHKWKIEVDNAITPQNPLYKLQNNEFTRGGKYKPVVVLKTHGGKHLECFSTDDDDTLEYAYYIKMDDIENLNEGICDAIAWQCAADVIIVMKGDPKGALAKVEEILKTQTY